MSDTECRQQPREKKIAVYPGSFDPVTVGHLDIIRRASRIFDEVIVCVMVNVNKHCLFTVQERVDLLKRVLKDLPTVRVDAYQGLLMRYVQEKQVHFIVKGLRSGIDFEYENSMEFFNHRMDRDVETVYLASASENTYITSSAVRELLSFGGDITGLVPPEVEKILNKREDEHESS